MKLSVPKVLMYLASASSAVAVAVAGAVSAGAPASAVLQKKTACLGLSLLMAIPQLG